VLATREVTIRRRVSATRLRGSLSKNLKAASGRNLVLVENRRQDPKYLVDKQWLDALLRERESLLATLEVLADRELTERLLKTSQTVDQDLKAGRLRTMQDVFGRR